ncbi:organic cation transporter protein-like [Gigantopelta aegis]|uniref:organic cation transporter protein-like n=1 Tax=Gigantopelta aegis TaxID=1735272 RepID=UPI001B8895C8|nr:organic cation transporter protein-like [Gigantopelta aegis]
MTSDDILTLLGGYGRFQMLVFVETGLVYMSGCWFTFAPIYLGFEPGHHCRVPPNSTANESISGSVTDGVWVLEKCTMFSLSDNSTSGVTNVNATQPCDDGWTYLWDDVGRTSFVSEWDLVCGSNYLAGLSTTVYMAGGTVGAILLTPFSDRFGRKWVMLGYFWAQSALAFGVAWADNIITFTALRFFIGALNMASSLVAFVMMIEMFPSSHRMAPSVLMQGFWSAGVMTFALFGFLVYDWRHIEMLISLPSFLTVIYAWLLPESILWLISKGRLGEAERVLRTAAKTNRKDLPSDIGTILENVFKGDKDGTDPTATSGISDQTNPAAISGISNPAMSATNPDSLSPGDVSTCFENQDKKTMADGDPKTVLSQTGRQLERDSDVTGSTTEESAPSRQEVNPSRPRKETTVISMFREPKIRIYCVIMFYLFFVISLSYFGTIFSTPTLHGNRFLNLFISGAIEIPALLICTFVNRIIGRRIPICLFLLVCSAMNTAVLFLPAHTADGVDLAWLNITLVMIGKFGITGSYSIIYLYASEIFPTTIRNHALGIASFFENVGGICAPIVVYAAKTDVKIPLVIFAVGTVIGGILVLILPETHKRPLPQTISDVVSWKKDIQDKHS